MLKCMASVDLGNGRAHQSEKHRFTTLSEIVVAVQHVRRQNGCAIDK